MKISLPTHEPTRWIIFAAVVVVAFFTSLYFRLLLIFIPFPPELAEPTGTFVMGFAVVLAGAVVAPRGRLSTAVCLLAGVVLITSALHSGSASGSLVGGLVAVALVWWWSYLGESNAGKVVLGAGLSIAIVSFLWVIYQRRVDKPARPDAISPYLEHVLGTNTASIKEFHEYDLGGFIDHEWLWRIDASTNTINLVVNGLKLQPAAVVPPKFWRMPPHYWPRLMPSGASAFETPRFPAVGRGPDGSFYFLVHDRANGRAFVWFKSNF